MSHQQATRPFLRRFGSTGLFLYGLSVALWMTAWAAAFWMSDSLPTPGGLAILLVTIGSPLAIYPAVAYARRLRQQVFVSPAAVKQYSAEQHAPIFLFLREFESDSLPSPDRLGNAEEDIADRLKNWGIPLAIGRPGERLPSAGCPRLYLASDEWQTGVSTLMDQAQLIVVRLGSSPGLSWELEQLIARHKLDRVIFLPAANTNQNALALVKLAGLLRARTDRPVVGDEPPSLGGNQQFGRRGLEAVPTAEEASIRWPEVVAAPALRWIDGRFVPLSEDLGLESMKLLEAFGIRPMRRLQLRALATLSVLVSMWVGPKSVELLCGESDAAVCQFFFWHGPLVALAAAVFVLFVFLFFTR